MYGAVKESIPVGRRRSYTPPHGGATLEFWSEGGMVCLEDQASGEYIVLTQAEARERFAAIAKGLHKIDLFATGDTYFQELHRGYSRLTDDFYDVLREARAQGDPMESVVVDRK